MVLRGSSEPLGGSPTAPPVPPVPPRRGIHPRWCGRGLGNWGPLSPAKLTRDGAGGAPGAIRGGGVSESVAKAPRAGIGIEKKRGISTILLARSSAIEAFATDLDNRRRQGPSPGTAAAWTAAVRALEYAAIVADKSPQAIRMLKLAFKPGRRRPGGPAGLRGRGHASGPHDRRGRRGAQRLPPAPRPRLVAVPLLLLSAAGSVRRGAAAHCGHGRVRRVTGSRPAYPDGSPENWDVDSTTHRGVDQNCKGPEQRRKHLQRRPSDLGPARARHPLARPRSATAAPPLAGRGRARPREIVT